MVEINYSEAEKVEEGKKVRCPRKGCGYVWSYLGKSEWYTSCPRCRTSVNVRDKKIKTLDMFEKEAEGK